MYTSQEILKGVNQAEVTWYQTETWIYTQKQILLSQWKAPKTEKKCLQIKCMIINLHPKYIELSILDL